jgi:hypothetical protein
MPDFAAITADEGRPHTASGALTRCSGKHANALIPLEPQTSRAQINLSGERATNFACGTVFRFNSTLIVSTASPA